MAKHKFTDYYLKVNLDERGLYSASVYDPNDKSAFEIKSIEQVNEMQADGFLKYAPDEDLDRLTKYLMDMETIPSGSQIYSEQEFDDKIREKYQEDESGNYDIELIENSQDKNKKKWRGIVSKETYSRLDEIQNQGGFKRYSIDLYDDKSEDVVSEKGLKDFISGIGIKYEKGGAVNFRKPNIKMSDALYQDLAESSVKVIDKVGKNKVLESYKDKPVGVMWEVFHEVSFQKNNPDHLHPSFKRDRDRRVVAYDENFREQTDQLNDNHIQSAMKSIFNQVFPDAKMASGGEAGEEEEVDLFEDYENQPKAVAKIVNKYFTGDGCDYETCAKALAEMEAIGYTFEYGLSAEPYGLRKIKMASGGSMSAAGEITDIPKNIREKIVERILTNYNNNLIEKEDKLKELYEYYKIPYSRQSVKDVYYHQYKSKGGYKPYEEFTSWIFEDKMSCGGLMYKGGAVSLKDEMKKILNHFSGDGALIFGGSYFNASSSIIHEKGGKAGNRGYYIYVTPISRSFKPHIWKEGGWFATKESAEFQAKQMRKMKDLYKKVEVKPSTEKIYRELSEETHGKQADLAINKGKKKADEPEEEDKPVDKSNMEWNEVALLELKEHESDDDIEEVRSIDNGGFEAESGSSSWMVFENDDDARDFAIDRVKQDLEDDPSMFTKSWLNEFIYITDTDKRMIAGEQADAEVENMSDSELIEEADMDGEKDELEEKISNLETEISELEDSEEDNSDEITTKEREKAELESDLENLPEKAKEQVQSDRADKIESELDDPIQYFVKEQGIYSEEDLLKQSFINIDEDKASEDAVDTDGIPHFLAGYDHEQIDLPSGAVAYRTN